MNTPVFKLNKMEAEVLPNPDEKGENGGLDDRSISKHSNSVLAEEEDLLDINRNIFNLVFKKNIRIFIFF